MWLSAFYNSPLPCFNKFLLISLYVLKYNDEMMNCLLWRYNKVSFNCKLSKSLPEKKNCLESFSQAKGGSKVYKSYYWNRFVMLPPKWIYRLQKHLPYRWGSLFNHRICTLINLKVKFRCVPQKHYCLDFLSICCNF